MDARLLLIVAVAAEVLGATALKLSAGFTKAPWVACVAVSYGLAFYIFSLVVKTLPLGLVYTAWAGLGATGAFAVGVLVFGEPVSATRLVGAVLVVAGVAIMNGALAP